MIIEILGIIIGVLVLIAGIYYLVNDKEKGSGKIYGTISLIGAAVAAVSLILLL